MLDYYLLANLFEYKQIEVIQELKKYQNPDGGFGHALEPDIFMPDSNVVSTIQAIDILFEIEDSVFKDELVKSIVEYFESAYKESLNGWELVPPEVDKYPHAVWWNYTDEFDDNYSYGNPNPQIIGFLYENSHYLNKLDIDFLIKKVIHYIQTDFPNEARKHNLLSCLHFYNYMPVDIQNKLKPILQTAVDKELESTNWEEYVLEPYEILLVASDFLEDHQKLLNKNIDYCINKLNKGLIKPNWNWYQYESDFEEAKKMWTGRLTFNVIKAVLMN